MKLLSLVLLMSVFTTAQALEIKKYNVSNNYEAPAPREIHDLRNDTDLLDDDEFIVSKEENGCKLVIFHEKSGTGFVDKSLCEQEETE